MAFFIPPLALFSDARPRRLLLVLSAMWGVGIAVFFLAAAGPGALLIALAGLLAALTILVARKTPVG